MLMGEGNEGKEKGKGGYGRSGEKVEQPRTLHEKLRRDVESFRTDSIRVLSLQKAT